MSLMETTAWYLARIKAMGPAEILHRLAESGKKLQSRRYNRTWDSVQAGGHIEPLPVFDPRHLPTPLKRIIEYESKRIASGEFNLLGAHWPFSPMPPPPSFWHLDPDSGQLANTRTAYCFDIPFRHGINVPEIKRTWELNRLQFLVPLAVHAAATANSRLSELTLGIICSWMNGNPPYQ